MKKALVLAVLFFGWQIGAEVPYKWLPHKLRVVEFKSGNVYDLEIEKLELKNFEPLRDYARKYQECRYEMKQAPGYRVQGGGKDPKLIGFGNETRYISGGLAQSSGGSTYTYNDVIYKNKEDCKRYTLAHDADFNPAQAPIGYRVTYESYEGSSNITIAWTLEGKVAIYDWGFDYQERQLATGAVLSWH